MHNIQFLLKIIWIFLFSFILIYFYIKQRKNNRKPFNILNNSILNNFLNALPIILFSVIIIIIAFKIDLKSYKLFSLNNYFQILLLIINYLMLGFLFVSYKSLGESWRYNYENDNFKLVTSGVYSYTRNPVFIFYNFSALIWFLLTGNLWALMCLIFMIIFLHRKVLIEEKYLFKKFGKEYQLYAKKVPRYF